MLLRISGNRNFICKSYLVLLLPGSSMDFIIGHKELKELLLLYINL
jgi:intergrase/recombinase